MKWSEPTDGRISLELSRDELDLIRLGLNEGTQLDAEEFEIRTGWRRDDAKQLCAKLGDAVSDPRWRDQAEPRPVHQPPREPRELAFYLYARARRVPSGFTSITVTAWAIANSYGARFEYTHPDSPEPVDVTMATDAAELIEELRHSTYESGRGGWYNAVITIDRRVDPSMDLDFDGPPAFPWPISAEACRADLAAFPRRPDCIPGWMGLA